MLLHKIHLNLQSKEARRDVANPYEMHSTLARAFSSPEKKCFPNTFLWRLEPETRSDGTPIVLIQSNIMPDWSKITIADWFSNQPESFLDVKQKINLCQNPQLSGRRFRYRLRANPCVCHDGKRLGLYKPEDQESWLLRQYEKNGMVPIKIHRSHEKMLEGRKRSGELIRIFSVLYDGVLEITDSVRFIEAVSKGIGHGKALGLGLLSVVPIQ